MGSKKRNYQITKVEGSRFLTLPLSVAIACLLVVAVLAFLLWSAKWKRDPHALEVENSGDIVSMLPSLAGITQGQLDPGNRVEVLQNGDGFFPRLFADIEAAKESVHIETFIWWEGELANKLAALLISKAKQGVEVRLLVDGSVRFITYAGAGAVTQMSSINGGEIVTGLD